jgi:transcriptional regulator with PAS, ATPase and Fis domain
MDTDFLIIDPRGTISDGLVQWSENLERGYILSPSFGDSQSGWIWHGLSGLKVLILDLGALDPGNRSATGVPGELSPYEMADELMNLGESGVCPMIILCPGRGKAAADLQEHLEKSQNCHTIERRLWKSGNLIELIVDGQKQIKGNTFPESEGDPVSRQSSSQNSKAAVSSPASPVPSTRDSGGEADFFQYDNIIGVSAPMQSLYDMIDRIAAHDVTVLINGESGTGKELVASCIHYHSSRRNLPFVKLNCAALPETLLESELFGHEKGSFTGAIATKKGKFELADQGTIFLDEVGDMTLSTQVKILRVLQEREFERIGGTGTIKVDVRVITATNRNLVEEIRTGRFREDLFYRLNVVNLTLPPLRERKEDIILLAAHFLDIYSRKFSKFFRDFDISAIDVMMRHDWPGNVRELENVVARAVVLGRGETIMADDLPVPVTRMEKRELGSEFLNPEMSLSHARCEFERVVIVHRLKFFGWNVTRTASSLGLERSNLYRKMKKYGIDKEPAL